MADILICGFCARNLDALTLHERESHYEAHFNSSNEHNNQPGPSSQVSQHNEHRSKFKKRFHPHNHGPWKTLSKRVENDIFWYPSMGSVPPPNHTPGLVPIIRESLDTLLKKGKVSRAVLCQENVVHIGKELWDASWGCGYRNFLMLCTCLYEQHTQPLYSSLLDTPPSPSIRNLQAWLQTAWDSEYDRIGRIELKNTIMGTNKWIGTAEIYVALSFRGIPAQLVDFNGFADKKACAAAVVQWMVEYFAPEVNRQSSTILNDVLGKTSPISVTGLMPVILQHRGHSRLIIGYERDKSGKVDLLTFDTGRLLPQKIRDSARSRLPGYSQDRKKPTESQTSAPMAASNPPVQYINVSREPDGQTAITLYDLLTPSEVALETGDHVDEDDSKSKSGLMSHLKIGKHKKQSPVLKASKDGSAFDASQVQKVFKLTQQQLSGQAEYQALFVPLIPPLTDVEKAQRKVVVGRRITSEKGV